MSCRDVQRAIRNGQTDDASIWDHSETCDACAELLADSGALGEALAELPALPEVLEAPSPERALTSIRSERGIRAWGRSRSTTTKVVALLIAIALVLTGVMLFHPRPDLEAYPIGRMAVVMGVLGLVAGTAGWARLRPLHRSPLGRRVEMLVAIVMVPLALAVLPEAVTGHMASMNKGPFWPVTLNCFMVGSLLGASIFVLVSWFERRTHVPLSVVGLSAAAMGVTGNLALQLFCPLTDPWHLLYGHASIGLVWAAIAVAGAWVVRSAGAGAR